MHNDLKTELTQLVGDALAKSIGDLPQPTLILGKPKQAGHGDYACSIAMQMAKSMKRNPRELATVIVAALPPSPRARAELSLPSFNLHIWFGVAARPTHKPISNGQSPSTSTFCCRSNSRRRASSRVRQFGPHFLTSCQSRNSGRWKRENRRSSMARKSSIWTICGPARVSRMSAPGR